MKQVRAVADSVPSTTSTNPQTRRAPAVQKTLSETVAEILRHEILSGDLPPGARLRQVEISERLGTSTTPVREAFVQLAREGLVFGDPRRGVVVFTPEIDDLIECYEMRSVLESLAARLSVPDLTRHDIRAMEAILDELHPDPEISGEDYIRLNKAFHSRLYSACGRPRLMSIISELEDASLMYIRVLGSAHPIGIGVEKEHAAILDAARRGNAEEAAELVAEHLDSRRKLFVEALKEV
jgi:DNA-binding GntR family transcriptional regulator